MRKLFIILLFLPLASLCQDTVYTKTVKYCKWAIVNPKTGKVVKHGKLKEINVDSGYVVNLHNGKYLVNNKEMFINEK